MKNTTIRRLQSGDAIPTGVPQRIVRKDGYVVLRWRVGPYDAREALEHRVTMGLPVQTLDVHHVNGVRNDNRAENLAVLDRATHRALKTTFDTTEAINLYQEGWSYPRLAKRYGLHPVTVMRTLKNREGHQSRPAPQDAEACKRGHVFTPANTYQWRNRRICRACHRERARRRYHDQAGQP